MPAPGSGTISLSRANAAASCGGAPSDVIRPRRGHPAGIIPAAILFGVLYQGGAELAFDMPAISRDMIVIIQGLVILFAGAMENMFRPGVGAAYQWVRFRTAEPAGADVEESR